MHDTRICVVGLGYVGLPLAVAFAKKGFTVSGYDKSSKRIEELKDGVDRTREIDGAVLKAVPITYADDPSVAADADIIIFAIPTPIDARNEPDLAMLRDASLSVGKHLKKGAIAVYESTVYPGTTEEICGPILAKASALNMGTDFTLGYSPERINPGDKTHTIDKIVKIVAGQDEKTTDTLCSLYGSIVDVGIHRATSIKVAEMAKAIENAQRDLNIAFINEIAMLCHFIGIPTKEVLNAASTKWNFLPFKPGLVGGHCIGVDPYYLVAKARELGIDTHIITAGRAVNDGMGLFVAEEIVEAMGGGKGKRVLVLGMTFKENIPDVRNSKSIDVVRSLEARGCDVEVDDPHVAEDEWERLAVARGSLDRGDYDAVALIVPHREYVDAGAKKIGDVIRPGGVVYDLKSVFDPAAFKGKTYLSL